MREIYRRPVRSFYSQVWLVDSEDPSGWPVEWRQDDLFVLGPKGVAVGVAEDSTVEVAVYVGHGDPGGSLLVAGEIAVGRHGVTVGTPTGVESAVPVAPGRTRVRAYTEGPPRKPTRVTFVLSRSSNRPSDAGNTREF